MKIPTAVKEVGEQIHFDAQHVWLPGEFDNPTLLIEVLKELKGLEDYPDDLGNMQSSVRIDTAKNGYWVTIPAEVKESVINASLIKKTYEATIKDREKKAANNES